jgi:hypothetical protein
MQWLLTVIGKKTVWSRRRTALFGHPVFRLFLRDEEDRPAVPALPEQPLVSLPRQEGATAGAGEGTIAGHTHPSDGEGIEVMCTG